MDSILARALAKIEALAEQESAVATRVKRTEESLARRREALQSLQAEMARYQAFAEIYNELANGEGHLPAHGFRNPNRRQKIGASAEFRPGTNSARIEDSVVDVLRTFGHPMSIGNLLDAVVQLKGDIVNGSRPRTVLAAILSRSRKVYYDHPHGWKLTAEGERPIRMMSTADTADTT